MLYLVSLLLAYLALSFKNNAHLLGICFELTENTAKNRVFVHSLTQSMVDLTHLMRLCPSRRPSYVEVYQQMSELVLKTGEVPEQAELVKLYNAVGWQAYTQEPEQLLKGVRGSLFVATAYVAGELVGLARIVGDGYTIAYLQDILVNPDYQHRGIGKKLMEAVFAPFNHCRQHVLITDDEDVQRSFYESCGFTEARDFGDFELRAFVRFNLS